MPRSEWKETLLSPGEGLGVQAGLPGAPSLAARYLGNGGGSVAMGGGSGFTLPCRRASDDSAKAMFDCITLWGAASVTGHSSTPQIPSERKVKS